VAEALHPSETVVSYLFASARGHQQAMVGGIAGAVGGGRSGSAVKGAAAAGITLASPMALVLTEARLITVQVGNAGVVKRVLDRFALAEVGMMTTKRLGPGGAVTLELRGVEVKLEARVGASRAFAEDLARARAEA
jgi:hypothetical protein